MPDPLIAASTAIIVAVINAIGLAAVTWMSWRLRGDVREVHLSLNSRLDDMLAEVREAAFAAGEKAEKEKTEDVSENKIESP